MAKSLSGVNPKILQWARARSGYKLEEVARRFNKDVSEIEEWESEANESAPTYVQLEKLAYELYKWPLAIFFFPEPPDEPDLTRSFRTLPEFVIDDFSPDTRHALREAATMQFALSELNDGVNPSEENIFLDIHVQLGDSPESLAREVRTYLGVDLTQQSDWKNNDLALKGWRDIVQEKGIFIFKRSFKDRGVSGFSLMHDEFPVIYLNNSTAHTRQIFTVFHELAHMLLHTSGVTKQDDSYIDALSSELKDIEVFCNQFAAEFLVPSEDFETHLFPPYNDEFVEFQADRYKVSGEVILRKLLDRGLVQRSYYREKVDQWANEYENNRSSSGGGGDYYYNQITYLGEKYLNLAFGRYYQGRCTLDQLSDYVNVKALNVPTLEQYLFRRATA